MLRRTGRFAGATAADVGDCDAGLGGHAQLTQSLVRSSDAGAVPALPGDRGLACLARHGQVTLQPREHSSTHRDCYRPASENVDETHVLNADHVATLAARGGGHRSACTLTKWALQHFRRHKHTARMGAIDAFGDLTRAVHFEGCLLHELATPPQCAQDTKDAVTVSVATGQTNCRSGGIDQIKCCSSAPHSCQLHQVQLGVLTLNFGHSARTL